MNIPKSHNDFMKRDNLLLLSDVYHVEIKKSSASLNVNKIKRYSYAQDL